MHIGKWIITFKDLVWVIVCLILVLCFSIGMILYNEDCASAILSGASTAISIVLSIVAILYTMLEGANSSQVNQDSRKKLEIIELYLKDMKNEMGELKKLEGKIRYVGPKIGEIFEQLEQSSQQSADVLIDDDVKKSVEYLMKYINEDIDD